ncbi:MAG: sulfatase [Verrucomicrobiae bacterium]|nr:sulfatase [Verrucomicrobiae bacterium]NNJ86016.1 sulfatase [Akkermansiaceae bacterium]
MKIITRFIFLLPALLTFAVGSAMADDRPNLLFILSDDHRADELSCAGNKILKTPELDKLVASGVRFPNAFVTTPICAASRASILTGLVERTHGFTFNKPPVPKKFVASSYPVKLKKAGYHTGFYGKFGVAIAGGKLNQGASMFDKFQHLHRTPYFKKQKDGSMRHVDEIIGDRAVSFIRQRPKDRPFCLSLSFNIAHAEDRDHRPGAGHFPWPKSVDNLYKDTVFPEPRLNDPAIFQAHPKFLRKSINRIRYHWRWDTPEKYQENMRGRYRMITGMDKIIGRVVDTLEKEKLDKNTIIIFMGDNGYYRGQRGFAGKWSHYEESLRVPLIIRDPRATSKGKLDERVALNIDIAPTLLAAAGVEQPSVYQGVELLSPATKQKGRQKGRHFFCEHQMVNKTIPMWEGVRTDRYTYARYTQQKPVYEFLHDRQKDPDQLKNLVKDAEYAETLKRLRALTDQEIKKARAAR